MFLIRIDERFMNESSGAYSFHNLTFLVKDKPSRGQNEFSCTQSYRTNADEFQKDIHNFGDLSGNNNHDDAGTTCRQGAIVQEVRAEG